MTETPPDHPAGPFEPLDTADEAVKTRCIETLRQAPAKLRHIAEPLTSEQLDTKYRNWTIRQIVHHIADSHLHSYVRFKWTLTEETPLIKAYPEGVWSELPDAKQGDIEPSLVLADGLHARWVQCLELMTPDDYERKFVHPETNKLTSLWTALNYYAWHSDHHLAQIEWVCRHHGW